MTPLPQNDRLNDRRSILAGLGGFGLMGGLSACAPATRSQSIIAPARPHFIAPPLAPLRMDARLITRTTVCLRPFRAVGPRLEVETVGDKRVVHNYGHGGSGWSLSWGSAAIAAAYAMEGGTRDVAVIGCGALGVTAAITLQRAGAKVTIYASERLPLRRSARASGMWTPSSRIADADRVDAAFPALWERMARLSWAKHQTYVGLPGEPVSFIDRYILADAASDSSKPRPPRPAPAQKEIRFAEYEDALDDILPHSRQLSSDEHPFPVASARRVPVMQFNVADLADRLTTEFLVEGGRIETRTFNTPAELTSLSQPVIVNCTGYGARALFGDDSIVPVRGQIAWLPPQPEVRYSLYYNGVGIIPRSDGVGVQALGGGDMRGYADDNETPDRAEAEGAIARIATLFGTQPSTG
ncbi:FAD-dependent oxidoreductase [soil metagenome]